MKFLITTLLLYQTMYVNLILPSVIINQIQIHAEINHFKAQALVSFFNRQMQWSPFKKIHLDSKVFTIQNCETFQTQQHLVHIMQI